MMFKNTNFAYWAGIPCSYSNRIWCDTRQNNTV